MSAMNTSTPPKSRGRDGGGDPGPGLDQRVFLHNVSWDQFETLLGIRGDCAGVRMAFLRGEVELMGPSWYHEGVKTCLARLLEAWTDDRGLPLNGFGSWTLKERLEEAGAEPDECYVLGPSESVGKQRPDLALEVVWTHGGLDKLEIYRRLGVGEVWNWENGRLEVFCLEGGQYVRVERSRLLPDLDLESMVGFLDLEDQAGAVRRWRESWQEGE